MLRTNCGHYFVSIHLLLISVTAHGAPMPNGASVAPAQIQSARATASSDGTVLDIALTGRALPLLTGSGKDYVLTLPNTIPSPTLAANMVSGGLVVRLAVETAATSPPDSRLCFSLSAPSQASITTWSDRQTVRIRLASIAGASPELLHRVSPGHYEIDAYQTNVATLLKSLSRDGDTSVVMSGPIDDKVTVNLHNVTMDQAIDLLSKAAGLTFHKDGATYMVGLAKDVDAAYPKPHVEIPPPPPPVMEQAIYRCRHVVASELAASLSSVFDRALLKVTLGASASSPRLDDASTESVTGVQANTLKANGSGTSSGGGASTGVPANGLSPRMLVLSGEQSIVEKALKLADTLDARRQQVKVDVKIMDVSTDALKQLGVQWTWSQLGISEQPNTNAVTSGTASTTFGVGTFGHTPMSVNATVTALEQNDSAKLLAAPSLSLLDGERSFILIGQRLLYPTLVGYTQANTPIFDKEEVRVGIYLQVSVQIATDGEITLVLYPQVSQVTSYLNVNGASYPQISTREQQTTVRVKDGQQIIVGGLLNDQEAHSIQKVPFLSSIPFFGDLFNYRNKTRSKDELVIMLTPQITKD